MPEIISTKTRIGSPKRNAKVNAIVKLSGTFSEKAKAAIQKVCDGMGAQIEAIVNPKAAKKTEEENSNDT